jgi:hypothetical protein
MRRSAKLRHAAGNEPAANLLCELAGHVRAGRLTAQQAADAYRLYGIEHAAELTRLATAGSRVTPMVLPVERPAVRLRYLHRRAG